jgi:signal transduction histidine kinase
MTSEANAHDPQLDDRAQRISSVVHDLRHCLHVLRMGLTLLKSNRIKDEEFLEICGTMEGEERRATELVEELVAFARGQK